MANTIGDILTDMTTAQVGAMSSDLWTGAQFCNVLRLGYTGRVIIGDDNTDTSDSIMELLNKYTQWLTTRRDGISRIASALNLTYEVLDNYGRTEVTTRANTGTQGNSGTTTHTGTDTNTDTRTITTAHGKTVTETPDLTTVDTPNLTTTEAPNITETGNIYGYNSATESPDGKKTTVGATTTLQQGTSTNTQTGTMTTGESGTTKDTHAGSVTNTKNLTDTLANTRTDDLLETVNSYIHGNVGVTTNVEMIIGEIELRRTNYIAMYVSEFINLISDWG